MLKPPSAFFQDDVAGRSLFFDEPREVVVARGLNEVAPAFSRLEQARRSGKWIAGYIAYEAGYALEPSLSHLGISSDGQPLVAMGVFDHSREADLLSLRAGTPQRTRSKAVIQDAKPDWDFGTYEPRFERIAEYLRSGDCYQVNLTFPVRAKWTADAEAAFRQLVKNQPVRYGALIDFRSTSDDPIVISRSPELFFTVDREGYLETHPMKGTAARGKSASEDAAIIAAMRRDEKTLAENCMIVDVLRNDVSVISELGTVCVPKIFEIETYPTLHQMVSKVRAKLKPRVGLTEIFRALFPCASVTGAPKIRAMQIIAELEQVPRGVYCGAIGYCDPDGPMRFSVAIRTLSLYASGGVVFNIGGGIVYDSQAQDEYMECLLKARFAVGDQWTSH